MATERFEIQVAAVGAKEVARDISSIGTEASVARSALSFLRAALVVIASARIVGGLFDAVDAFTNMSNRLKLVTNNAAELVAVQQNLFIISQDTRTSFEANNNLFATLAQTTTALNLTYKQLLDVTKAVAIATSLSGSSAEAARLGLVQFSQGLALGTLRGQDLKSVVQQLPYLANVLGKEFGVAGASLAAFANANPGIITTQRIIKALTAALPDLESKIEANTVTISQGFERLKNAFIFFIGSASTMTGAGRQIASVLTEIADHIDVVTEALFALGAVVVFNILADQMLRLKSTVVSLAFIFGNVLFNAIKIARLPITLLGSLLSPLGLVILGIAATAYYFRDSLLELVPATSAIREAFNKTFAFIRAGIETVIDEWQNLKNTLLSSDFWGTVANRVKQGFIDVQNAIIEAGNKAAFENALANGSDPSKASYTPLIPNLDEEKLKLPETAQTVAEKFKELFNKYLQDDTVGDVKKGVQDFLGKLHDYTRSGIDLSQFNDILNLKPPSQGTATLEIQKLSGAIRSIVTAVSPLAKAGEKIKDFQKALADPKQAGLLKQMAAEYGLTADVITTRTVRAIVGLGNAQSDIVEKMQLVDKYLKDSGASAEEVALLYDKLRNKQYAAINSIVDSVDKYASDQRKLKTDTLELDVAVSQHLITQDRMNQLLVLTRRNMDGVGNAALEYSNQLKQLKHDLDDNVISQEEFGFASREAALQYLNSRHDLMSGIQRGLLQVEQDSLDLGRSVGDALASGFRKAEDALVDFVMNGKFNFKDLANSIIADLIRIQIRSAVIGPIAQILGSFAGATFGSTFGEPVGALADANRADFAQGVIAGLPARADGGSVLAGQAYTVGERGAETFIPNQSGTILPNGALKGNVVTVTVINTVDGAQATTNRSTSPDGSEHIEVMLQKAVASGVRKPGSPINKAIKETFAVSSPTIQR